MRILYLSQLVPYPPDAGAKVRIYHVLQSLAAAGHQVTLVAFRRENDRPEHVEHLRRYCEAIHTVLMERSPLQDAWHVARGLLTGHPFLIGRDEVPAMHRLLRELAAAQPFDAIHADQLWMAQYALAARNAANEPIKTVLDQHNAMYLIPQRLAAGSGNPLKRAVLAREARHMVRYEIDTCRQFDQVVWVTDEDRQAVAAQAKEAWRGQHTTIPICVDPGAKAVIPRPGPTRRVTFLGGLHWPPNAEGVVWFAREVWPAVRAQAPEARLTVIGKQPPAGLETDPSIDTPGYVPDITPYLAETAAFIVPLHAGGGMRVKILDAWAWGLPVVSTTIGAEGIRYRDGDNLLIADDPAGMTQAVVRLLQDPELGARLAASGREMVETHYNWRTVYGAWDEIYKPQLTPTVSP